MVVMNACGAIVFDYCPSMIKVMLSEIELLPSRFLERAYLFARNSAVVNIAFRVKRYAVFFPRTRQEALPMRVLSEEVKNTKVFVFFLGYF